MKLKPRLSSNRFINIAFTVMSEEMGTPAATPTATAAAGATTSTKKKSLWPSLLRWIPTSTDHIISSEKRLLSLVKY